jgi:hypothetical protein
MADEYEKFNTHQQDTKSRFEFLIKSIILLSGGTLTISFNIFTNEELQLTDEAIDFLQMAWKYLSISIGLSILSYVVMVLRDYSYGEIWRKHLGKNQGWNFDHTYYDFVIIIFGVLALGSFIFGLWEQYHGAVLLLTLLKEIN